MIALPDGWRAETAIGSLVFADPERTIQARYRMRVAPIARVGAVVDAALAALPGWRTEAIGGRERFATHEGEHVLGVAISGTWLDAPARRYVGVVYADDHMNILDAVGVGEAPIEPRARALLHGATLGLGARRRRYFYQRPAGWRGHATGLVTHWFPARFPARPATIVVYPANPTHEAPHAVFDAVIAHQQSVGAEPTEVSAPAPIVARQGLEGLHWTLSCMPSGGPRVHRDLVVFVRRAFTYALQLDAAHQPDAEARATFLDLARSVEPIPPGGAGAMDPTAQAIFSHYV